MGGWPCGWKGEYMEGKMIVYLPNENEGLHTDILYDLMKLYCETIIEMTGDTFKYLDRLGGIIK